MKFAIVTEMDFGSGKARVRFPEDDIVSDWLPVIVPNVKNHKWSFPLSVNEQVCCLMDSDCQKGVILGAVYSKKTEPSITDGKIGVVFSDDSRVDFDPSTGKMTIETSGEIEITATSKLILNCDLEVTGKIEASQDITALAGTPASVGLSTHLHPTPAGPSSPPTPGT